MSFLSKAQVIATLVKMAESGASVAEMIEAVKKIEPANVAPVHYAKWVKPRFVSVNGFLTCSNCHNCYVEEEWVKGHKWKYCPDCGAKFKE